jgi:hypothetical protein
MMGDADGPEPTYQICGEHRYVMHLAILRVGRPQFSVEKPEERPVSHEAIAIQATPLQI